MVRRRSTVRFRKRARSSEALFRNYDLSKFHFRGTGRGRRSSALNAQDAPWIPEPSSHWVAPSGQERPALIVTGRPAFPAMRRDLRSPNIGLVCGPAGSAQCERRFAISAGGAPSELAWEQPLTAHWNLHLYAGPSCLSRVRHAVVARVASHATPLACAPCRPHGGSVTSARRGAWRFTSGAMTRPGTCSPQWTMVDEGWGRKAADL